EDDGAAVAAGVVDVEGDGGGSGGGLDAGHGWCSFDDDDDGRAGPFVRDARCGASGPQRRGTARSALGPRPVAAHDGPVRTYPGERWVRGYLGDVAVATPAVRCCSGRTASRPRTPSTPTTCAPTCSSPGRRRAPAPRS